MDAKFNSDNIFKIVQTMAQNLVRCSGIGLSAAIILFGLADKVTATYLLSDFVPSDTYIDSQGYNFLDKEQYYYLDKGQYNVIGKPDYFLGFPLYPNLYDKEFNHSIGFTNIVNKRKFAFWGEQVPIIRYALWSSYDFSYKDYFYNRPYYFSDKGQYNLSGGITYSLRSPYYPGQLGTGIETLDVAINPEPSTIIFLGLGAIGIVILRKKSKTAGLT
jgi:hypothetical protein